MSLTKEGIAYRVARDLPVGSYVNLGIGIPSMVAGFLPEDKDIFLHSENGILGFGEVKEEDKGNIDLLNANKDYVSLRAGASLFDHTLSFTMIRGGHLTHAIMGAIQVAANGDLANWTLNGQQIPGVGGAMDLAFGTKNLYVAMTHVTKKGQPKIVYSCDYPLTAPQCVKRIFTDLAVIDVTEDGLLLKEVAPGVTTEEVQNQTDAPLKIYDDLQVMDIPEEWNGKRLLTRKR